MRDVWGLMEMFYIRIGVVVVRFHMRQALGRPKLICSLGYKSRPCLKQTNNNKEITLNICLNSLNCIVKTNFYCFKLYLNKADEKIKSSEINN
jgi:hypothetical protein